MNKKGAALILAFMVITLLTILAVALITRSISESNIVKMNTDSAQAFWLAEAGVSEALVQLRTDYSLLSIPAGQINFANGATGQYSADIAAAGINRIVTGHGFVPSQAQPRVTINVQALISDTFFTNAIYSSGDVRFSGNSYQVNGNVRFADEITDQPWNVNGSVTNDPSINPLKGGTAFLQNLFNISLAQGNVYNNQQDINNKPFPASFWNSPGVPNVIYIREMDLNLNNIGTIAGFFVVGGDPVTNPNGVYNVTINGNGQMDGVVYCRGEVRINGGGGGLNINAGIWAGEEVRINGNVTVGYMQNYMSAIRNLMVMPLDLHIIYWKDLNNPYLLQ